MIDIINLSLSHEGERVIENFSLRVEKGEKIALMGPSGCGKTSLLSAIAGLLKPEDGRIKLEGRISCVFQEPRLLPWLSALENINAVLSDSPPSLPEAQKWLDAVGLGADGAKLPGELSGGMQQRISIARALAYGGDILLLDEPLKGMDADTKAAVWEQILSAAQGKTCILVTHDEDEALSFGGRIYRYSDKRFI
ncbi:MAG: ABC transporter ATP-binding protein [Ruminococcaceae bacterium]|nr:ABC transporter ATP-binding protein [Oscillospiraceae bacterium]